VKYILNKKLFKRYLLKEGYKNILDFSRKTSIHRNTIKNYLSGKSIFSSAFEEVARHLNTSPLELIEPISDSDQRVEHLDELKPIIGKIIEHDKSIAVILLGSRAKKHHKKYSDWDLGITRIPNGISDREYLKIKSFVDDLADDLPRKVDVINIDVAPSWFFEGIDYEPVFLDGNKESYIYFKGVLDGIRKKQKAS